MKTYKGTVVSKGYAIGTLKYLMPAARKKKAGTLTSDIEYGRFISAKNTAVSQLNAISKALGQNNETASALMSAHSCMADDPDFADAVNVHIYTENDNAENAVQKAGEEFALLFEQMEGDIRTRGEDIRDIANRIINILSGENPLPVKDSPVILAAENLPPSEIFTADKENLLAVVLSKGASASHTAILARAYGIPMITGLNIDITDSFDGLNVIVNGFSGELIVNPDGKTLAFYKSLISSEKNERAELENYRGLKNTTLSGKTVKLYCNIHNPGEVKEVTENDGNGIGLFRSEFLFMGKTIPPTEDEQFDAYKQVLSAMGGNEVIIRTMDIGADKEVPFLNTASTQNPALGLRGIGLSLTKPDLFRTQLRALYRASHYGNLKIMFPMITNLWEVVKAKEFCKSVVADLKSENFPVNESVPLGIMIETPAAVLTSDILAGEVDFFSLGTNDLTRYLLACDRTNENLKEHCDTCHPTLLRIIKTVIQNAHEKGIPVGICGEAASDGKLIGSLINMGIDGLSVNPKSVLLVRKIIRSIP